MKEQLQQWQVDKIYKLRSKWIAKYLAIQLENLHLPKSMITLTPKTNTYEDALELRNYVIKKLNNIKYKDTNNQLAYFSSIEIDSKNIDKENEGWRHWHVHIQLYTNIHNEKIQSVLNNLPDELSIYNKHSIADNQELNFSYVIKDLQNIDWELQCAIRKQDSKKQPYSCSRTSIAGYVYKAIAKYMRENHKTQWRNIKDKYGYMLQLIENKQIMFDDTSMDQDDMIHWLSDTSRYDNVIIKKKNIIIFKELFGKKIKNTDSKELKKDGSKSGPSKIYLLKMITTEYLKLLKNYKNKLFRKTNSYIISFFKIEYLLRI